MHGEVLLPWHLPREHLRQSQHEQSQHEAKWYGPRGPTDGAGKDAGTGGRSVWELLVYSDAGVGAAVSQIQGCHVYSRG